MNADGWFPIAGVGRNRLVVGMTQEGSSQSQGSTEGGGTENIETRARLKRLQEKIGDLAETLESVEKNLANATGESAR